MSKKFNSDVLKKIFEYHESQKKVHRTNLPNIEVVLNNVDCKGLDVSNIDLVHELSIIYNLMDEAANYHDACLIMTNAKSNIIHKDLLFHFSNVFLNVIWVDEGKEHETMIDEHRYDDDISLPSSDDEEAPILDYNRELDEAELKLQEEGIDISELCIKDPEEFFQEQQKKSKKKQKFINSKESPTTDNDPSTSTHNIDVDNVSSKNELTNDQFRKLHTDIMSNFAHIKKSLVSQHLIIRQLSEKLNGVQTELKNITAILPLIRPTHTSVLETVRKY